MTTALVAKQTGGLVFAGPVGSLDSYIDRVSQIPVLSKEDEVALAVGFRSEADLEAAQHRESMISAAYDRQAALAQF